MAAGVGQRHVVAAAGRVQKMSGAGRRRRLPDQQKGCCLVVVLRCCVVGWMVAAATAAVGPGMRLMRSHWRLAPTSPLVNRIAHL
jgi:hypothetical protein